MKKLLFVLFLIFIVQLIYSENLKIIWWNVHDFFDTKDDEGKDDEILTNIEYKNKLNLISEKLRKINADIVSFAEIENINTLKDIAYESGYPFYYLIEGNDPRGIDVCLISKWEIAYKSNKDFPTPYKDNINYKFSRDCPEASFIINGKKIYLLLNHLKSDYGQDEKSLEKRIAQVKGILDIIAGIYKENNNMPLIIIAGDFNSNRYSEPMNIFEKSGLIILNYLYNKNNMRTYDNNGIKDEIDFFIINDNINNILKSKNLKCLNSKEFKKISDHYPLLLELQFK